MQHILAYRYSLLLCFLTVLFISFVAAAKPESQPPANTNKSPASESTSQTLAAPPAFRVHTTNDLYYNKLCDAPYFTFEFEELRITVSPFTSQSLLIWVLPQLDTAQDISEFTYGIRVLEIPAQLKFEFPHNRPHIKISGILLGIPITFTMTLSEDLHDIHNIPGLQNIDQGAIILDNNEKTQLSIEKAFYVYETNFFVGIILKQILPLLDRELGLFHHILNQSRRQIKMSDHPLLDTLKLLRTKVQLSHLLKHLDKHAISLRMQREMTMRFESANRSAVWSLKVFYPQLSDVPEDEVWQRIKDNPSELNHDAARFLLRDLPKAFFTYLFNRSDITDDQRLQLENLYDRYLILPPDLPSSPDCLKN